MTKVRHYPTDQRPFLEIAENPAGGAVLRVRQATEQGYIECEPQGVFDAAYPSSQLRRSRVKDRGRVAGTLMAGEPSQCLFIYHGSVEF